MSTMTALARAPIPRSLAMRMNSRSPTLRRRCACGQHSPGGGECASCADKGRMGARPASGPGGEGLAPPIVHDVLRSPGQMLQPSLRRMLEPRFGQDFSGVRVHAGARAAEAAQAVDARAFTVGRSIVLGQGHSATSGAGLDLMAHELAHTVQQADAPRPDGPIEIGPADHPAEREADRLSSAAMRGDAAWATPAPTAQLQRQENDKPIIPLPHPFDRLDPGVNTPLGQTSVEGVRKGLNYFRGMAGRPAAGGADCRGMPGFSPGGGSYKGQCCNSPVQSLGTCCPPQRMSVLEGRCCTPQEVLKGNHCVLADKPAEATPAPAPKSEEPPPPRPPKPQYQDAPEHVLPQGQAYA